MSGFGGGFTFGGVSQGGTIENKQDIQLAPIPTVTLADGEEIFFRINIPQGYTFKLFSIGIQNSSNNLPAGLLAEVIDETNNNTLVSKNVKRDTGDPLVEVDGNVNLAIGQRNSTGGTQNSSATFAYTIEEQ